MERIKCPICGEINSNLYLTVRNRFSLDENFKIVQCNCSFKYLDPRPDLNEIGNYYKSTSYIPHKDSNSFTYKIAQLLSFRWKVKIINKYINKTNDILDFGSGSGKFKNYINSVGFNAYSADPYIPSDFSSLDEILDLNKQFEAITMWHSIEHIHELNLSISKIKKILTENGILFIAIPNHHAVERKYFNEDWIAYDAPRHLYHFDYNTIKIFLEKNNIQIINIYRMYLDTIYNILYSNSSYNIFYKFYIIIMSVLKIFKNKEKSSSILIVCKK